MTFTYQATTDRSWIVSKAQNHWSVRPLDPQSCQVEALAVLELRNNWGIILAPLLKVQLNRIGKQVFEELKFYIEESRPHPRKLRTRRPFIRLGLRYKSKP